MIKFCAQMEIQRPREQVWEQMMREFPPQYRHVGKVDLAALDAEGTAQNPPESPPIPAPPSEFDAEILDWREGHSFVARFTSRPYLRGFVIDLWLKEISTEKTTANIRLELTLGFGCLLMFPARIGYWLFQKRIDRMILQTLAGMRYEIETGKTLEAGQERNLPLERIQKIRCR